MADCTYCLENGRRVDGGDLGRCSRCAKRKCRNFPICHNLSGGKTYCIGCQFADLEAALRARATSPFDLEVRLRELDIRARKEFAREATQFLFEAVLCVRRSLMLQIDALYGGALPARGDEPPRADAPPDIREAA